MDWNALSWLIIPLALVVCCGMMMWMMMMMGPRTPPRDSAPTGTEKDPNLCVPGKEETAKIVKDLLKGTGLPAATG